MTATPAPTEAGARSAPWPGIWAGGVAIAAAATTATTMIGEPVMQVPAAIALFLLLGLFPASLVSYLASRARRAQDRFCTSKWLYLWGLSRVAFFFAIAMLAAGGVLAWAAGSSAVTLTFVQALILTLMVSVTLGLAGGCALNIAQAISGPERHE